MGMNEETLQPDDEELIRSYLSGSEAAFNVLYERYRRPLYAYLNKFLDNHALADDLFQQTWIKAIHKLDAYENRQKFLAWLIMIAHNLAIDAYRKEKISAETELDDNTAETLEGPAAEPWRAMHNAELEKAINTAVSTLQPELKEVFLLRRNDVPFKEIAKIQNCSINTALGRMNYAIKQLRKQLQNWIQ